MNLTQDNNYQVINLSSFKGIMILETSNFQSKKRVSSGGTGEAQEEEIWMTLEVYLTLTVEVRSKEEVK